MTFSTTTTRVSTAGDGSATAFSFPYLFFDNADLVVTLTVDSTGVETVQTITTHYTVVGAGVAAGGTVTMGSAPASGQTLLISRVEQFTQGLDLVENDNMPSELVEKQFDILTMLAQQTNSQVDRSLRQPNGDTVDIAVIPAKITRASKVLAFNSAGNPETTIATSGLATLGTIPGDISTVAGISANVTTVAGIASDVTAVAADATDIGAVAAKATEIGRLGTADAVADMNTLGTAAIVTDMDLLGTSGNVTAMGLLGTSANVTAMSALSAAAVLTDMSILGTADVVNDMNILGTADVVTDMNVLATADVVTDMNTLGTAAIVTDMDLLGTTANVTAMGLLGVASVITDMGILGTADVVTDMNVLGTADVVTDMNTLGTGANVTAMATVAANVTGVNSFAERYRVASSDPVSSLDEGDLYYNTTSNVLRFYNGSTWLATVTTTSGDLVSSNNLSDVSSATTALSNLGGVARTAATGSANVPAGTTAQRDGSAAVGMFRYNSTTNEFEGYSGASPAWGSIGGGAGYFKGDNGTVGSSAGDIFRVNEAELNTSTTILAAENASATGPLSIASGVTLTVAGNVTII
jgi:hypothetical protein